MSTDIIIPVWNLYEYTRQCIESVYAHTPEPFTLIIVDNASDEPTKGYLEALARQKSNVKLLRNEQNLGFPKAVNRGIAESSGEFALLLNNDTLATTGWLQEMIKVAQINKQIGIVNANSNTLGAKPKAAQSIEELALELKSHSGEYTELAWATGFCMLIKREVIAQIGTLDEAYGMGNFEDADFCKRALAKGYLSVCASAAYVYHRERQSFMKFKEFSADFTRLRETFYAKWGRMERILYVLGASSNPAIEKITRQALQAARQGNVVWMFCKGQQSAGWQHHSNLYVYALAPQFFNLVSLWRIIKKKKKFRKIYVDDLAFKKKLISLKLLHKAEVLDAE